MCFLSVKPILKKVLMFFFYIVEVLHLFEMIKYIYTTFLLKSVCLHLIFFSNFVSYIYCLGKNAKENIKFS